MEALLKVKEFLLRQNPPVEVIVLEADTSTAPLAAKALGVEVGAIAKTIVAVGKSKAVLVVAAGDVKLDFKKLKAITGEKMRLARTEEVEELTGFKPGGVCPFALSRPLPILIDESLERFPVVYAAAGSPNSAVPVTVPRLLELTGGQKCQVTE